jgi:MacB-like periplasmic core domain
MRCFWLRRRIVCHQLSYKFWRKHYLSNPDVLGHTLQLDHKNFKIVGVAAPRFAWGDGDVYLPLKLMCDPGRTSVINLLLRPGVSPAAADAALQPLVEQFASYGAPNELRNDCGTGGAAANDAVKDSRTQQAPRSRQLR